MKGVFLVFVLTLLAGCEPFNLQRLERTACVAPSANVGASVARLQADLFADRPTGDVSTISWTFGDGRGLPQQGSRVTYLYDRAGSYTVTMTLTNRCKQVFTANRTITVAN